jgi:hypothetical protein
VVKWQTVAVPYLQLSYSAYGRGRVFLPAGDGTPLPLQVPNPATHPDGFEIPDGIRESTTFYLSGYNGAPPPGEKALGTAIADANCTVTVQHPTPKVSHFEATPAVWPFELGPALVTLNWAIDWIESFGERSLTLSGPGAQTLAADQSSCTVANVGGPQKWTLRATGSGGIFSQAGAELKSQSLIDYLYNPPRRYKGTLTIPSQDQRLPSINITLEIVLSDSNHNTYSLTVTPGFMPTFSHVFDAIVERDLFIIPGASFDPSVRYHYRVSPGALTLIPADIARVTNVPTTLYEEKS